MRRQIYQVNPRHIKIGPTYANDVRRQKERLEKEGQIEPIEVLPDLTVHPEAWAYSEAQIQAARDLGWDTILVTY
jgi:hypothetical protein